MHCVLPGIDELDRMVGKGKRLQELLNTKYFILPVKVLRMMLRSLMIERRMSLIANGLHIANDRVVFFHV